MKNFLYEFLHTYTYPNIPYAQDDICSLGLQQWLYPHIAAPTDYNISRNVISQTTYITYTPGSQWYLPGISLYCFFLTITLLYVLARYRVPAPVAAAASLIFYIVGYTTYPFCILLTGQWLSLILFALCIQQNSVVTLFFGGISLGLLAVFSPIGLPIAGITLLYLLIKKIPIYSLLFCISVSMPLISLYYTQYQHTGYVLPIAQTGPWLCYYIAPHILSTTQHVPYPTAQRYLIQAGEQAVHTKITSLQQHNRSTQAWYEREIIIPALPWIIQHPARACLYWLKNVLANICMPYSNALVWKIYHLILMALLISFLLLWCMYGVPAELQLMWYIVSIVLLTTGAYADPSLRLITEPLILLLSSYASHRWYQIARSTHESSIRPLEK